MELQVSVEFDLQLEGEAALRTGELHQAPDLHPGRRGLSKPQHFGLNILGVLLQSCLGHQRGQRYHSANLDIALSLLRHLASIIFNHSLLVRLLIIGFWRNIVLPVSVGLAIFDDIDNGLPLLLVHQTPRDQIILPGVSAVLGPEMVDQCSGVLTVVQNSRRAEETLDTDLSHFSFFWV